MNVWQRTAVLFFLTLIVPISPVESEGRDTRDLPDIRRVGSLRHLGVPYANFVTGAGDGLSVELITLFADHLGVRYRYVRTSWPDVIADLSGVRVLPRGAGVDILGNAPVKGDLIASGLTVLAWRQKVVTFSEPTFPTQVWLVARADADLQPITPTGDIRQDIQLVKDRMKGLSVVGKENTCLDPSLYELEDTGARVLLHPGSLNELAPAVLNRDAEAALLDVPDALIALEKWPGRLKVIGPVSPIQDMAVAFPKGAVQLKETFDRFFEELKSSGAYRGLVRKYYPSVLKHFPGFFR
ncbi:MAG: transporter substrate-binding domain-containing protein [Deltaproteobacteria bacterium]|nr:transporter substrate-binding domain-containing protein [Deltaproteobacteria bacterium]